MAPPETIIYQQNDEKYQCRELWYEPVEQWKLYQTEYR